MTSFTLLTGLFLCLSPFSLGLNEHYSQRFKHCEPTTYPPSHLVAEKYVLNLDLPPAERWTGLIERKKEHVVNLIQILKDNLDVFFNGRLFKFIDKYFPYLAKTLPEPYRDELAGIAKVANTSVGEITLYNLFYEIFTFCTSIIVEGENGHIYHGRNLDFGILMGWDIQNHTWLVTEALHPLVVEVDFQRGGNTVFKSVNFAGYIGVLTGMKPDAFSISLDERFQLNGGYIGILEWIFGKRDQKWAGFLLREIMEKVPNFETAVEKASNAPLLAPVYLIISGTKPGEGMVITRDRKKYDLWRLGQPSFQQISTWFLVETNYDHWKSPPFFDNRRTPAILCLNEQGQKRAGWEGIYRALSTKPVLNKVTTYTTLMDARNNSMVTYLRDCPDPCAPW
ncbi:acid ceramidase-like [Artemia franciscana]|uniref:acid ceramidase-like n=1 Tax=Artemia franciscana TaxID=6661 RepID=UPI0032DA2C8D